MDPVTKGILIGSSLSFLTVVIQIIFNYPKVIAERKKMQSESDILDTDTMGKLSKQINELITDKVIMNDRIDKLEADNRKWLNALARAIRFIHEKDPLGEIPNFLLDTSERK